MIPDPSRTGCSESFDMLRVPSSWSAAANATQPIAAKPKVTRTCVSAGSCDQVCESARRADAPPDMARCGADG